MLFSFDEVRHGLAHGDLSAVERIGRRFFCIGDGLPLRDFSFNRQETEADRLIARTPLTLHSS